MAIPHAIQLDIGIAINSTLVRLNVIEFDVVLRKTNAFFFYKLNNNQKLLYLL